AETTIDSGKTLAMNSGRDTTLAGAQVSGDKVDVDVGRNLTLSSQQDSDLYDMKQQNASAGGSFTWGSMSGSGYLELDYQSSAAIGISVTRGATSAVPATNARIIIGRDPSMPDGYKIITGYPTP
ncbi:hemagglutinin repeat-containing protein, partial [Serratia sp. J2]|uniref:hemagglutinin repeat-containing protein n=1 Tax=Serratia sp. J2 TaxID=3386551 RepID=UPI003916EF85